MHGRQNGNSRRPAEHKPTFPEFMDTIFSRRGWREKIGIQRGGQLGSVLNASGNPLVFASIFGIFSSRFRTR
jgi:hypothetical protein